LALNNMMGGQESPKGEIPIAETRAGVVSGKLLKSSKTSGTVAVFLGIPYAKPPIGELRWRPPEPPCTWGDVRRCCEWGDEAPQFGVDFFPFFDELVVRHGFGALKKHALLKGSRILKPRLMPSASEDCLYLNVWTSDESLWHPDPLAPRHRLHPVFVWFHGGNHHDGAGGGRPYYGGLNIPERGKVVVVSFNYRLGILGHFTHPELSEEDRRLGGAGVCGNYSVLDQIAALKWVKSNISNFGGDPNCVTICGNSAGGESVLYMMTSPLARGLFHRAIAQSPGTALNSLLHLRSKFGDMDASETNGEDFARRAMGGAGPNSASQVKEITLEQLHFLRNMSADDLLALYREDGRAQPQPLQLFHPVLDGYVLPASPIDAFMASEQAPVPLLIGYNEDEGSLLLPVTRERTRVRDQLYPSPVREVGLQAYGEEDVETLSKLYDPDWLARGESGCRVDEKFLGERVFAQKVYWIAAHHGRHPQSPPVYVYTFAAQPPQPSQTVGTYHGAELSFLWGVPPWFLTSNRPEFEALSETMVDYWAAFAKEGDPNAAENRPHWPQYGTEREGADGDLISCHHWRMILNYVPGAETLDRNFCDRISIMHKHVRVVLDEARAIRPPLQSSSEKQQNSFLSVASSTEGVDSTITAAAEVL
jgi:para-nitrobenzyl esterase